MAHGYIFEVPSDGAGDPTPLRDMGRYSHEAVAVDPVTGFVYETEDAGNSSGLYRFVPAVSGNLSQGGRLFMMKVVGVNQANLTGVIANDTTFDVEWVEIATPDNPAAGVTQQLRVGAGARAGRGDVRTARRRVVRGR